MIREAKQVHDLVVEPTMQLIGLSSISGNRLTTYTGQTESQYDALRQVLKSGNYGAGFGWWQMQENAYKQCVSYLNRNINLKKRILAACYLDVFPDVDALVWNIRLACCMARIQYWQEEEPLPGFDDLEGLAAYYVKYYNRGGKASIDKFVRDCAGIW